MDSKLKRTVIFLSVFMCVSVIAIVAAANWKTVSRRINGRVSILKESAEEATESSTLRLGNDLYAWKNDETFFDTKADTLAMQIMEEMNRLTASAVSIERDLRIQILDYQGELKTGEAFKVKVSLDGKTSTYEDSDKDGIIYTDGLEPGDYTVSLEAFGDYEMPDEPLKVKVPDKAECTYIEDINLLIKEKTGAQAQYEDVLTHVASSDADKKQNTSYGTDTDLLYGVDLSDKNEDVDFKKVYGSGIRFAMLRAGYRGALSGDLVADEAFTEYAHAANRNGLAVGVYFDSQAVNRKEAIEEASLVIYLMRELNITYPVYIRLDLAGGDGRADSLDSDTRTEIALAFEETIKNAGYETGVYSSAAWFNTNLDTGSLEKEHIWLSEYRKNQSGKDYYYDLWQYTDAGTVDGINEPVCLNVSYMER